MKIKNRDSKKEKRKRNLPKDDSSDEESVQQQPAKKAKTQEPARRFTNTREVIRTRDFKLKLWTGPGGEDIPSEETKLLRKTIGVNVKGNCKDTPAPLLGINNEFLPEIFRTYCQGINITNLSAIQKQAWPTILNGANVIGISPTGSGKTLAFVLPAIHHILSAPVSSYRNNKATPFVLALAPARELAIQIHTVFKSCRQIAGNIKIALLYGGQEKQQQIDQIRSQGNQCRVLVATPGRLLDVLQDRDCPLDLNQVSYQVIDEADRMLAMGFLEQLQDVSSYMHPARQMLLFSATFPGKLRDICAQWIPNHSMIRVNTVDVTETREATEVPSAILQNQNVDTDSDNNNGQKATAVAATDASELVSSAPEGNYESTVDQESSEPVAIRPPTNNLSSGMHGSALTVSPTIQQVIHVCAAHKKPRLLIKFIERIRAKEKEEKKRQADPMIVFFNKIKTLTFVHNFLKKQNIPCVTLHGSITQREREENLNTFRSGKINILICTDVAARGIHIKRLRYVVNYDFPTNLEQYCHRIGRCGRPGTESGMSSSVVAGAGNTAKSDMTGFAYSLMTRNMAVLSNDLISLLLSVGQSPEPNLQRLADDFNSGAIFDALGEDEDEAEGAVNTGDNDDA